MDLATVTTAASGILGVIVAADHALAGSSGIVPNSVGQLLAAVLRRAPVKAAPTLSQVAGEGLAALDQLTLLAQRLAPLAAALAPLAGSAAPAVAAGAQAAELLAPAAHQALTAAEVWVPGCSSGPPPSTVSTSSDKGAPTP